MRKPRREPKQPRPTPVDASDLEKVTGGYGVGNTGGVHPNPPIGPGG